VTEVVVGLGLTKDATVEDVRDAADVALIEIDCGWVDVVAIATTHRRRDHPAVGALTEGTQVEVVLFEPSALAGRRFDLVVVCNYLWRPLLGDIRAAVEPGGWLVWETFADGQQSIGRPSRPEFLLQRGELLRVCEGWNIVAYEDLFENGAKAETPPRFVQRVAAVRPP